MQAPAIKAANQLKIMTSQVMDASYTGLHEITEEVKFSDSSTFFEHNDQNNKLGDYGMDRSPNKQNQSKITAKMTQDLDTYSEMKLSHILLKHGESQDNTFDAENLLSMSHQKKKTGDSKLKVLKKENKQLKEQVKKLRELLSTDKILKSMKVEYNDCITECK